MVEVWKRMIYQGIDLGDYYYVSNLGEIRSVKTDKIRKKNIMKTGYYFVSISLGERGKRMLIKVHRAVAETFIKNPNNYPCINHIDGNKLNNNVNNLEFCTSKHNTIHARKLGLANSKSIQKRIIDKTNNIIFNSVADAGNYYADKNKFGDAEAARKNISRALNNNKIAYGIKWDYYEEKELSA